MDKDNLTLFKEKTFPIIHQRRTVEHLRTFLVDNKIQNAKIRFIKDHTNMVIVSFDFKTNSGKVQKNIFRYKTDPGDRKNLMVQERIGNILATHNAKAFLNCRDATVLRTRKGR